MNFFSPAIEYDCRGRKGTLAQHLGYDAAARLAILSADDFGLCPEVNTAVIELAAAAAIDSTSVMVPASAYNEAVARYHEAEQIDCGVHLTLTSALADAPARPLTDPERIPSLIGETGDLHGSRESFFAAATPPEAELEARAQIERALADGIDVTHLDSHEGTLQLRSEFAEIYLRLAEDYRLPLRMASEVLVASLGLDANWLRIARERGIRFPDNLVYLQLHSFTRLEEKLATLQQLVITLPPGVTEFFFHPAVDSPELQRLLRSSADTDGLVDPDLSWRERVFDFQTLASQTLAQALSEQDVRRVGFAALRELMRP